MNDKGKETTPPTPLKAAEQPTLADAYYQVMVETKVTAGLSRQEAEMFTATQREHDLAIGATPYDG